MVSASCWGEESRVLGQQTFQLGRKPSLSWLEKHAGLNWEQRAKRLGVGRKEKIPQK